LPDINKFSTRKFDKIIFHRVILHNPQPFPRVAEKRGLWIKNSFKNLFER